MILYKAVARISGDSESRGFGCFTNLR